MLSCLETCANRTDSAGQGGLYAVSQAAASLTANKTEKITKAQRSQRESDPHKVPSFGRIVNGLFEPQRNAEEF